MSRFTSALRAAVLVGGLAGLVPATATAEPNTGDQDALNKLAAALSKGYDLKNCEEQPLTSGELAALSCGQSPDPNGPVQARYVLFDNTGNLAGSFKSAIKNEALTACGEAGESPTVWRTANGADVGQVACGTNQNAAEVIWTTEPNNVLGTLRGTDTNVDALYRWWHQNG